MDVRNEAFLILSNIRNTCKYMIEKYVGYGEPCKHCPYDNGEGCIARVFFEEESIPQDWNWNIENPDSTEQKEEQWQ